jgi:hypothetical protein
MKNWNWKRIGLLIGAGAATALAAAMPPTAAITVPVLGSLSASMGLGGLAVYLTGWATRTPGHGPGEPPKP